MVKILNSGGKILFEDNADSFDGLLLANQYLRSAQLSKTNLDNVNFEDAHLMECEFSEVVFVNCKLSNAKFTNAKFENVRFVNCEMKDVDFASLRSAKGINIENCFVNGSTFENAHFDDVSFFQCDFTGCSFRKVTIDDRSCVKSFISSKLVDVDLSQAELSQVEFVKCELENVDVFCSNFSGADFASSSVNGFGTYKKRYEDSFGAVDPILPIGEFLQFPPWRFDHPDPVIHFDQNTKWPANFHFPEPRFSDYFKQDVEGFTTICFIAIGLGVVAYFLLPMEGVARLVAALSIAIILLLGFAGWAYHTSAMAFKDLTTSIRLEPWKWYGVSPEGILGYYSRHYMTLENESYKALVQRLESTRNKKT